MNAIRLAILLGAGLAAAQTPRAEWRVSTTSERAILFVDAASVKRSGDKVTFRLDHRLADPLPSGTNAFLDQVEANCASRSWVGRSSWRERRDGQNVIMTQTLTTTAAPRTVYAAALTAACTGTYISDKIADPTRFAAAYFAATGSVADRLVAAARATE